MSPYGSTHPAKRNSAALTDGVDRAPARAMLKGAGFTDADLAKPLIGVATTWIETMPCNLNHRVLARLRQAGHPRRGRHAARVQHDRRLRRRDDGRGGDARVARLARGDRRLDRARHARSSLRRPRLHRRLRQDDPRRGDGACAPRHPRARVLRRLDRGRALPRQGRDDPGRLRGGRCARGRAHQRRRGARARERRVPGCRRLRRPLHREHDGDGARLSRRQRARPERGAGDAPGQAAGRGRGRRARDEARARGHAPVAGADARGVRERDLGDRGDGRLDERRPAPAGDRRGGRDRALDRRLRHGLGAHADRRRHQARRPLRRDRSLQGRRRRARRARAGARRARPRGRDRRRRPHAPPGRRRRPRAPGQDVVVSWDNPLKATGGLAILRGNLAPDGCVVKLAGHERVLHRRAGAGVRLRGGVLRRRQGALDRAGRRDRDPLRGARRRSRACARCCTSPHRSSARASATRSR